MVRPIGSYFNWGRGTRSSASSDDSNPPQRRHETSGPTSSALEPSPWHIRPWPPRTRPGAVEARPSWGLDEIQQCFWLEDNLRRTDRQLDEFSTRIDLMQISATNIRRDLEDLQTFLASIGKRRRAEARTGTDVVEVSEKGAVMATVPRGLLPLELQPTWLSKPPPPLTAVRMKFATLVAAQAQNSPAQSTESLHLDSQHLPFQEQTCTPNQVEEVPIISPSYTIEPPPLSAQEIPVRITPAHLIPAPFRTPPRRMSSSNDERASKPGLQPEQTASDLDIMSTSTKFNLPGSSQKLADEDKHKRVAEVTEWFPSPESADEKDQELSWLASPSTVVETALTPQPSPDSADKTVEKRLTLAFSDTGVDTVATQPPPQSADEKGPDQLLPTSSEPEHFILQPVPGSADEKDQEPSSVASPDSVKDTTPTPEPVTPVTSKQVKPSTLQGEGKTIAEAKQQTLDLPDPPTKQTSTPPEPTETPAPKDKDNHRTPRSMRPSTALQQRFPLSPVAEASQKSPAGSRPVPMGMGRARFPPPSAANDNASKRASLKPVMGSNKVSQMTQFFSQMDGKS